MTLLTPRFVETIAARIPGRYALEPDGAFRIDQYHEAPAFSSFLPGIAGPRGVPLWCFYVNRAQAVASFGASDKDHAVLEFLPATWAYQLVGIQGFRTFLRLDGGFYEPFSILAAGPDVERTMRIRPDSLELVERSIAHEIQTRVEYVAPVGHPLAALLRRVTITNLAPRKRRVDVLDGLPVIVPAGFTDFGLKHTRHLHEAFCAVRRACGHVAFYSGRAVVRDTPDVALVHSGNFYAAWLAADDRLLPIEPFVDPAVVFGGGADFVTPREFIARGALDRAAQVWENRLPCAFAATHVTLEPEESLTLVALAGHAPDETLLARFLQGFRTPPQFGAAFDESRTLLDELTQPALLASSSAALDAYARQSFLDNIIRGGTPHLLPARQGPTPLHLYARRHGDLERDYNAFSLPPHPLSSGAGNFRDVCQNRRWDAWFDAVAGEHAIRTFVELLQADGFNPLTVEGYRWKLAAGVDAASLCPLREPAALDAWCALVRRAFQPGELLRWATRHGLEADEQSPWFVAALSACDRTLVGRSADGGYWTDHWTYIADLLESYAAIYPDRVCALLSGAADVGWFDDGTRILPRRERCMVKDGHWLQMPGIRHDRPGPALTPTTLMGKLCALVAIKAVSFDPAGRGIEMEAGRPSWNDALNGLPGQFGSCTRESAELARLAAWLLDFLPDRETPLPAEVADFIDAVVLDLESPTYDWERANNLREQFRARLDARTASAARPVSRDTLRRLLYGAQRRAGAAVAHATDPATGLLHTYFVNRPAPPAGLPGEQPHGFESQPLPLFIEGQVHLLRLTRDPAAARRIYDAVRASALFDAALRMYRNNVSLEPCSPDIGRIRQFTRSWFENESIWLHQSYKYLIELLRCGLPDAFFADAATMLVPFMDPATYGRSILENCSFIASSVNPDPNTHGRGFIARLSGTTAEFQHLSILLAVGQRPFRLDGGELCFAPQPTLPGAWFTTQPTTVRLRGRDFELPADAFAIALLGHTLLVYHNAARRDTFGPDAVAPTTIGLDDQSPTRAADLRGPAAEALRAGQHGRVDVWLE